MTFFDYINLPIAISVFMFWILAVSYFGLKLAKRNGADVRVIWYFFSLAAVVTYIAIAWAKHRGAIDTQGMFLGDGGAKVQAFLKFMLGLDTDIILFLAILTIVLLPQIFNYILSGVFGCASAPVFVSGAIRFIVWGVVKSFVVVAGILLSAALYGYINQWTDFTLIGTVAMLSVSTFLLASAFIMLCSYREAEVIPSQLSKFLQRFANLHRWLTRHIPSAGGSSGEMRRVYFCPANHNTKKGTHRC